MTTPSLPQPEQELSEIFNAIYQMSPGNFRFFVLVCLFCSNPENRSPSGALFLKQFRAQFPNAIEHRSDAEILTLFSEASVALEPYIERMPPVIDQISPNKTGKKAAIEAILMKFPPEARA